MLVPKLSFSVGDRWNRTALSFRENSQRELCLKDFISFFGGETILVNDPVCFRETIGKYARRPEKKGQKKRDRNKRYTTLETEVSSYHEDSQEKCSTANMILINVKNS